MQGRDKAGSLEIVGKVLPDERELPDLEDDDIEEPTGSLGSEEELVGTPDAEELALSDIGEGPEEIGLDVETGSDERAEAAVTAELLDSTDSEEGERWSLDDRTFDIQEDLELEDDEQGWTEDSEGMGGAFDEEVGLSDEESPADDGGLEGVDDPMLDSFALEEDEDEDSLLSDSDDLDDDEEEDLESDFGDSLLGRE